MDIGDVVNKKPTSSLLYSKLVLLLKKEEEEEDRRRRRRRRSNNTTTTEVRIHQQPQRTHVLHMPVNVGMDREVALQPEIFCPANVSPLHKRVKCARSTKHERWPKNPGLLIEDWRKQTEVVRPRL